VKPPEGVLHLKIECSLLDEETILVTRRMEQSGIFDGFQKIVLSEGEEPAANVIRINEFLLVSSNYSRTIDLLDQNGYFVVPIKTAEIQRIDAGLSCMSLLWEGIISLGLRAFCPH
jgi:dimethylargininase